MHVLYLENTVGFGGSITGLVELIEHIPGIEASLLASYDVREYLSLPTELHFEWIPVANQKGDRGGLVGNLARLARYDVWPWVRAIARIHRRHPIDLVHANNASLTNIGGAVFGRLFGVPVISHQKCFEYEGRLNRTLLRHTPYARHIGTSPSIAAHLVSLGLAPEKCVQMFEPVRAPASRDVKRWCTPPGAVPVIGMYSMLTPWKGQDVFLKAIAALRQRTQAPFRVVLAGSAPGGDTEYPKKLRHLAGELGIGDLVEFHGHIREVYSFLTTLDVAVHASVSAEPFGRVVAEAMVCGVPVVVSSAGGPSGYVKDGETGLHAAMGDPADLARVLQRLVESPTLRQSLATAGRAFALEAFDPDRLGREMAELYRSINRARRPATVPTSAAAAAG